MTRKTIPNRMNREKSTVQISKIPISTVRIRGKIRFRYQEFRFQPYKTCKDYGFTVYKSIHNRKSI